MSNFFAEGNISDSDSNAGSEDKENANRHGPSYQYVLSVLSRTSWMKIEVTMRNELCALKKIKSGV